MDKLMLEFPTYGEFLKLIVNLVYFRVKSALLLARMVKVPSELQSIIEAVHVVGL